MRPLAVVAIFAAALFAIASPAPGATTVDIEEESVGFCSVDGDIEADHAGFSGTGYANTDNAEGTGIVWRVEAADTGTFTLEFRFANGGDSNRPAQVSPGGGSVDFDSTGAWTSWSTLSTTVDLEAGINEIVLTATGGSGLPNIDRLRVSGAAGLSAAECGDSPTTTIPTTTTTTTTTTTSGSTGSCVSGAVDVVVSGSGSSWRAQRDGSTIASGGFVSTVQAALDSGEERIVVEGDASMGADERISMRSNRFIAFCGTIDVQGTGSGDRAPIYARGVSNIEVAQLRVTGSPNYGIFMRNVENVTLGDIELRLSGGLGVRIDNHGDRSQRSRNITIDEVYVSGTDNHGVETYGVDEITINRVTARDTGYSGLLLNDTWNADVGTVDAEGAGTGTGYAAFRMANRNGRIDDSYPTNIRVDRVIARGGGRGVFCVSESGGAVIDDIDLRDTGNNAILIENCVNVTIDGGVVDGGGEIRLAARDEFPNNRDITIRNVTVIDNRIRESPCGERGIDLGNNILQNSSLDIC
jgi:hypothetical protein